MGYPNEAERQRLERFPDRIAVEDLRGCFALSDLDRSLVFDQRGPENRLGLAVSLGALRFLGFVPDDIASIPDEALVFVAGQVDAGPHELLPYGARAQTRSDLSSSSSPTSTGDVPKTTTASASRNGSCRRQHLRPCAVEAPAARSPVSYW